MTATTTYSRVRFEELIDRAEIEIAQRPDAYKRKLALLALLGYGYLFGILMITFGLIGFCILAASKSTVFTLLLIKKKLGLFLLVVVYVLCKALWVKLDPPSGYRLERRQFPILFREVDELGKRLRAPKIHEIVLTPQINAGIQQTPRLGVFGWQKNTLILGLLLMLGLSKPQLIAVIAHEFGHLSGNHSRFNGWIYRVRTAWWRIMEAFKQAGGVAAVVFGRFFDWYAPYFNAYSFALARANEYQADAVSAQVTSNSVVTEALVQTNLLSALLETEYWGKLDVQIEASRRVHDSMFSELRRYLERDPFSREERHDAIKKLLNETTGHSDTHPSLKDRIDALTNEIPVPHRPEVSAAETMFGEQLDQILKIFDSQWARDNARSWAERHEYLTESKLELSKLEKKQQQTELNNEERWKLAAWTEEFRRDEDPLPLYLSYWYDNQEDPSANYAVGRLMLKHGNADGLVHLIKAMREQRAVIPACQLAFNSHREWGNTAAAEEFRLKAEKQMDLFRQAEDERAAVCKRDAFENHGLGPEAIQTIRRQLQTIPKLQSAWLCRKTLRFFQDDPAFVLIYKSGVFVSDAKLSRKIIDTLHLLPGSLFLVRLNRENKALAKKALQSAEQIICGATGSGRSL
ncbi:MAG: M48 family metallopeptidase [Methylococcales bacterium]